ncbi:MAG: NifB/NifX family molybdenum-iron cluster-binding protein [Desulfobulbaceae bacterium]|nr:NifB/NifX family molybdenum-iron cluster-binding protein [Desulfobulbaceae bacterium]
MQKVAVTAWGHRVSPVFDSARTLLIAECVDGTIAIQSSLDFDPARPLQLVQLLRTQNIGVIICGAVSEGPASMLEAAGFELIPFIAGDVRKVLENFIRGNPEWTEFTMPGCDRKICCRGKIRRGHELVSRPSKGRQNGKTHQLLQGKADKNKRKKHGVPARENAPKAFLHGMKTKAKE